jgi:hypothetical protein
VGIQSIYRGAGVERRSNIVYFDLATSQIVTEPWNDETVGIAPAQTSTDVKAVSYYDATGRRVNADAKGLIIKSVTLSDGTLQNIKVINK